MHSERVVQAVLRDWRTAPVDPRVRAMLGFIEKLTLHPEQVEPDDIAKLRMAGLGEEAIGDGIHICTLFNIIDRIANALGMEPLAAEALAQAAEIVLKHGYRWP